jgi:ParB-like chromosome segregation protein Spo0J
VPNVFAVQDIPTVDFTWIKPYWRNPRNVTEQAVNAVVDSISRYGYQQPIIVDLEGVIITGHTRYAALRKLHADQVSVLISDLPPEKAKEYRVMDNKTGEYATWDQDALVQELRAFEESLLATYFSDIDLRVGEIVADTANRTTEDDVARAIQDITNTGSVAEVIVRKVTCPACYHEFEVRQD